jgi:CheY-like chemotaxis protein
MPAQLFILHIEDDHDDVELLQGSFKDNGYFLYAEVISEGNRVIPWLEQQTAMPDVIVMDLNLPKCMAGKS